MSGAYFTKLFSTITASTVWCEPHPVRIVWITMLAMADRKGRIHASIPGLANYARVTVEECEQALGRFMSPDKYSRTPDYDGKRIEPIDGGWRLLNYSKYREMRDAEERAEQNRAAQARYREKVSKLADNQPPSAQAEVEVEVEKPKEHGSHKARHAPSDESPIIQTLPLREGGEFEVRGSLVASLEPLYPSVDVPKTINEMKGWLILNPHKRKTRRGITRFIGSWLQNEQERANGV